VKAVVLSAGQGKRLLPLTLEQPKCLLRVRDDETILGWQLRGLARCGVERAVVVTGFGADRVEDELAARPVPGLAVETLYNPFYGMSDNLMTCWLARAAMHDDFLLRNGDTLFEDAVLARLLETPSAPVTVTIDRKARYDEDDMKVALDARGRLAAVDKALPPEMVSAESIGLLAFRGSGPKLFVDALERAVRDAAAMRRWYLSVVSQLARATAVETASIEGLWWREVDAPADLEAARRELSPPAGAAR
jgi:choline kinase